MPYIHRFRPRRDFLAFVIEDRFDGNVSAAARAGGVRPQVLHDILRGRREGHEDTLRAIADGWEIAFSMLADPVDKAA